MLREIKNKYSHYFMDELGRIQGEGKAWYDNGVLSYHGYYVDSKQHGESKRWYNGVLCNHEYYVGGQLVHDFIESPLTDVEKMLLVLKYGGLLLPRGEVC